MIPVFFRKINVVFFHWVNLFIISPEIIIQGAEVAPALVKGTANQIACVTVQMRISGDCAFGIGVKRNFSDFNTAGFLILGDGLADITAAAFIQRIQLVFVNIQSGEPEVLHNKQHCDNGDGNALCYADGSCAIRLDGMIDKGIDGQYPCDACQRVNSPWCPPAGSLQDGRGGEDTGGCKKNKDVQLFEEGGFIGTACRNDRSRQNKQNSQ